MLAVIHEPVRSVCPAIRVNDTAPHDAKPRQRKARAPVCQATDERYFVVRRIDKGQTPAFIWINVSSS